MYATIADRHVYEAEQAVTAIADADGPVSAYGSTWDINPLPTWRTTTDVAAVCTRICHTHHLPPVRVRIRRGDRWFTYERLPRTAPGPETGTVALTKTPPWSTAAILHELAHHMTHEAPAAAPDDTSHGPAFRQALVTLLATEGHREWAFLLAAQFDQFDLGFPNPAPVT